MIQNTTNGTIANGKSSTSEPDLASFAVQFANLVQSLPVARGNVDQAAKAQEAANRNRAMADDALRRTETAIEEMRAQLIQAARVRSVFANVFDELEFAKKHGDAAIADLRKRLGQAGYPAGGTK